MKDSTFTTRLYLIVFLLSLSISLFAQKTIVKVTENSASDPCLFATVILHTMDNVFIKGSTTDKRGIAEFDLSEKCILKVSYVGYKNYSDTLIPGETKLVQLEADVLGLETVVCTGQYEPKPVDKSIYKIDVISSQTMQARGVNNLAEALSNETSIRLSVDPSTGTSIEMQGMGGENVKYLIDGIPIVGRINGNIDLSQINMENVDHIEIVKGPMAVQYGTSAIAGVINIITKKNDYFNNLLKVNSYGETQGTYNFGVYGSVNRGKHSFTMSGNRNIFQGVDIDLNVDENDPDGHDRYMEFKPKLVYNADASYSFKNKEFQIQLKSQYMNSLVKNYLNYIDKVFMAYDADYNTTRSTNSLTISNKISKKVSYNIIGAYTYFGRRTDNITSDLALLTREITHSSNTTFNSIMSRSNLTYSSENKSLSLMAGWDINYNNGTGDKIEEGAEIGDYACYLSSQYNPFEHISIQPGLRFIYNTIFGTPLIPSLNIQLNPISNLNIRISYAKGFRAPSLKELYLDFKDSNHDLSGNKDLKAETTNSYNSSITYSIKNNNYRIQFEPSIFYNDGKDAITLIITDAESNSATNINLGGRRTLGGEFNTSFSNRIGFSIGAGMSRIGETYDYDGTGDYVPVIYYNNYTFNTKYSLHKIKTVLLANLKYYGKTPMLIEIPEEYGGGYYRGSTEPYGDLELTATKKLWENRCSITIGGKNLLNYYEIKNVGYVTDPVTYSPKYYGRIVFIKMNFKINS